MQQTEHGSVEIPISGWGKKPRRSDPGAARGYGGFEA